MSEWTQWPAPAKLNLFLHVLGRRADGYHDLETVFQIVDRGDTVEVRLRSDGEIRRCRAIPGIAEDEDLSVRAARRLQAECGATQGADLRVTKRLPAGGGLGGGSSNAATVLVALNALWAGGLGEERLAALGLELGADVPVFVHGHSAWGGGVGERLEPVDLSPSWYLVVDPGARIPTAEVFGAPELTRDTPPSTIAAFRAGEVRNDCEPVVRSRWPVVGEALSWLSRFGPARMSGTGGCCFAAFATEEAAQAAYRRLPEPWSGFVARGVERSPLHERLTRWRNRGVQSSIGA